MTTLLLGDCLEKMKGISDKSVDLIICDLPFGCLTGGGIATMSEEKRKKLYKGNTGTTINGCAWDIKIDLELFWKEIKRIRKNDHTPCLMFTTTRYGYELIKSNEKEFRYDLVWDKQRGVSFLSANKMPMRSHEMIYVFSKAGAKYNRVDIKGDFKGFNVKKNNTPSEISVQYSTKRKDSQGGDGTRCVLSVINFMGGNRKTTGHPTEKPLDLYKFLIERYSDVGQTVLDPTFGSGNSGLACIELKRKYIGIEKDNNFFWKAVKKLI
jgi:site-specific DNA-methyltransferase (adenine-specific)